ncbi:NAD dependent epimerase/dehydratase [Colletotrichum sojae]|uniref:NAD dependent epimerase/dehydratase n=1 Tax=Colletotrichum sojae TaxID=2175907 RepID=A0A8H6MRI1_9PEZI|nr:NAD dependent epimerase/dehydratase [Colletotrichum sojae]
MPLRVLLTGANGFIAQHILAQLLAAGHSVRAVVRTDRAASQLRAIFQDVPESQLDYAIVPDITAPGAFDAALSSSKPPFDVILHTASPFDFRVGASAADFLDPAINGTVEVLRAAHRVAPSVKRVVVTSSTAAVVDTSAPPVTSPPKIYTEKDWLETSREAVESAVAAGTAVPALPYVASKTLAERAAWAFVAETKPSFDLATINPPMVYGPVHSASSLKSPADLGQSNFMLYSSLLSPELTEASPVPPELMHLYVDVRDVARAHLLAATTPAAGGKRFVVSPGGASNQRIANIFRAALPQLAGRIPKGDPEKTDLPEGIYGVDSSLAKTVLGLEFTKAEDTFADSARQFIEIEEWAKA